MSNLTFLAELHESRAINNLGVCFVVQKDNFREIIDFIKLGIKYGVDQVLFLRLVNLGTYDQDAFLEKDVASPSHPLHDELLQILKDPLMNHEIVDAFKRILHDGIPAEHVDEELLSSYLYTADLPDPDLIIRTAGEMRLSNFLLWQAAYSEYHSTLTFWPDFGREEIEKALVAYGQRERRFGRLHPKAKGG